MLQQLMRLEAAVSYLQPPPAGLPPFRYRPGRLPFLISAPHGAAHRRNGRYKPEDEYTVAIARYMARATGAHLLYTCYRSETDPNWHPDAPYKRYLRRLIQQHDIRFVLDLHGMSNRHNIGLVLGTINGRSCPRQEPLIIDTLKRAGFRQTTRQQAKKLAKLQWQQFIVNHPRYAGGIKSHTVTRYVSQQLGVAAAQVELTASVRIVIRGRHRQWRHRFRGHPQGIETTVRTLITIVEHITKQLEQQPT